LNIILGGFLICDKIEDDEKIDRCYLRVARVVQDSSICDKIQIQTWKDDCYQGILDIDNI